MSERPALVSGPGMAPAPPPAPQPFTERLSDSLRHGIGVIVDSQRKPPRRLKSLFNGTRSGYPLHPVMTDVLITVWLLTAVFGVIWLISHPTWAAYGAFFSVVIGLLGTLGAIVTGLTDWSDTYGAERCIGLNHAFFNACATILYLVSFLLCLLAGPEDALAAVILGFLGLVGVIHAAYLGGDIVFTKGTGVNHTAWEAGSEDYEAVLPLEGVEENKLYRVTASSVPVVLLRQGCAVVCHLSDVLPCWTPRFAAFKQQGARVQRPLWTSTKNPAYPALCRGIDRSRHHGYNDTHHGRALLSFD